MFAVLLAGNGLHATAFLLSPDIARLLNGQNEQVIEAYENRIAQLRVEVDRLHSRSYAQAGDINLQLQELAQQQGKHAVEQSRVDAVPPRLGVLRSAVGSPETGLVTHPAYPATLTTMVKQLWRGMVNKGYLRAAPATCASSASSTFWA